MKPKPLNGDSSFSYTVKTSGSVMRFYTSTRFAFSVRKQPDGGPLNLIPLSPCCRAGIGFNGITSVSYHLSYGRSTVKAENICLACSQGVPYSGEVLRLGKTSSLIKIFEDLGYGLEASLLAVQVENLEELQ